MSMMNSKEKKARDRGRMQGYEKAIDDVGFMLDNIEMSADETWMDFYRKTLIELGKLKERGYRR